MPLSPSRRGTRFGAASFLLSTLTNLNGEPQKQRNVDTSIDDVPQVRFPTTLLQPQSRNRDHAQKELRAVDVLAVRRFPRHASPKKRIGRRKQKASGPFPKQRSLVATMRRRQQLRT